MDKIPPEKNKRLLPRREVHITDPMIDSDGNINIPNDIVINDTKNIFGPGIYKVIETIDVLDPSTATITKDIKEKFDSGFKEFKGAFGLTNKQLDEVKNEIEQEVTEILKRNAEVYQKEVQAITEEFIEKTKKAKEKGEEIALAQLEVELTKKKEEASKSFTENLNVEIKSTFEDVVEEQITKVEETKKKTTEDDVRDHLRGFARTIPAFLMAYGDENTTLGDFEKNIDEPTFEELTSITIDEFKKLRDGFEFIDDEGNNRQVPGLFNQVVFNASVKEFFITKERLSNYFDETLTEDIFDYIPPQKTNQIFTPRKVVNMMVDMLEAANPELFTDYTAKFLDPYAKSGLYIAEIVRRLYNGLKDQIPNSEKRIKWILENQVYTIAPSNIIYNIVKNFVYSDDANISTKNLIELDLASFLDENDWQDRIDEAFGGEELKFDVIIGNPPYQEMDGGAQASASPLYHKFVQMAKELKPSQISFIIPTRWYVGGKGLDEFRQQMLNDKHIRELHDWLTPDDIFPNTNIRGGVCYFLWDKDYDNTKSLTKVATYTDNKLTSRTMRSIRIPGVDILIRDSSAPDILYKIFGVSEDSALDLDGSMMGYVSSAKAFGFRGYFVRDEKFRASSKGLVDPVKCYAVRGAEGYVERSEVPNRKEWIERWKVFTAESNNIGTELSDDNFNTIVGSPGTICTETYVVIGAELDLCADSAKNLSLYLKTKFSRYLHSLAKISQHGTRLTYRFIPLQNFSDSSDIDWSLSIQEIDQQLFDKYGLTTEERRHIDQKIKDMDNM